MLRGQEKLNGDKKKALTKGATLFFSHFTVVSSDDVFTSGLIKKALRENGMEMPSIYGFARAAAANPAFLSQRSLSSPVFYHPGAKEKVAPGSAITPRENVSMCLGSKHTSHMYLKGEEAGDGTSFKARLVLPKTGLKGKKDEEVSYNKGLFHRGQEVVI